MLESIFLSQQINLAKPNFENLQPRQPTSQQIRQNRSNYVGTNSPTEQNFDRFLPKESEVKETPIMPQTTEESRSLFSRVFGKFMKLNSAAIRKDLKICDDEGGSSVLIMSSGGESSFECESKNGEKIDIEGELATPIDQVLGLVPEIKARISLGKNKKGQSILLYTQNVDSLNANSQLEVKPIEKKILFEYEGFELREETTYQDFFQQIQVEILKHKASLANDVHRCNLRDGQHSNLEIRTLDGIAEIICSNIDGSEDIIDFENLSIGTKELVKILTQSSVFGYNTKLTIEPSGRFLIKPLYRKEKKIN